MLMLINTRELPPLPPLPPDRQPHRPWRLSVPRPALWLVLGLVLVLLSSAFSPILAYGMLLAACACIGRGLGGLTRSTTGMRDYRQ